MITTFCIPEFLHWSWPHYLSTSWTLHVLNERIGKDRNMSMLALPPPPWNHWDCPHCKIHGEHVHPYACAWALGLNPFSTCKCYVHDPPTMQKLAARQASLCLLSFWEYSVDMQRGCMYRAYALMHWNGSDYIFIFPPSICCLWDDEVQYYSGWVKCLCIHSKHIWNVTSYNKAKCLHKYMEWKGGGIPIRKAEIQSLTHLSLNPCCIVLKQQPPPNLV